MTLAQIINHVNDMAREFQVAPPRRNGNAYTAGFLEVVPSLVQHGLYAMAETMKRLHEKAKHLDITAARSIYIELNYYMLPALWREVRP